MVLTLIEFKLQNNMIFKAFIRFLKTEKKFNSIYTKSTILDNKNI